MIKSAAPDHYRAWCWEQGTSALDLVLKSVSRPVLQPDEVLVRNHVAGLNPVDWKALGARLAQWGPGWVPGVDGAGIVVAVGRDVESECLGRRVAYHQSLMRPGSFAEYTPVRLRALIDLPRTLDFGAAAGVPCRALRCADGVAGTGQTAKPCRSEAADRRCGRWCRQLSLPACSGPGFCRDGDVQPAALGTVTGHGGARVRCRASENQRGATRRTGKPFPGCDRLRGRRACGGPGSGTEGERAYRMHPEPTNGMARSPVHPVYFNP